MTSLVVDFAGTVAGEATAACLSDTTAEGWGCSFFSSAKGISSSSCVTQDLPDITSSIFIRVLSTSINSRWWLGSAESV